MTRSAGADDRTELCRLTVLADHTQIDLALPPEAPLALLIPEIVGMIERHDPPPVGTVPPPAATEWTLGRLGHAPLDPAASLAEHGVRDGDLLVLQSTRRPPPAPLFDDLMHNVAAIGADSFRRWTPRSARLTGSAATVALTSVGALGLLLARRIDGGLTSVFAALVVAVLLVCAGAVTARVYGDGSAGVVLWAAAIAPAFVGGALIVPGALSAAGLLLGAVTTGAVAVLAARTSGVGVALGTAVTTVSALVACSATAVLVTDLSVSAVSAVAMALALTTLAFAPRLAMLLAKLPLPPVPSPGSPLDSEEDRSDTGPLASFVGLEKRAGRARRHLTGLVCAVALATLVGALMTAGAFGDDINWPGAALAVVVAVVVMLRGRTYASAAQAAPLIGSGTLILVLLLAGTAASESGLAPAVFAIAALGAGVAMVLGVVAPAREFSPVQRRAVELLDYTAIAAVIPLVCWVSGLFSALRGL
ncbi:type VII secretion integral membrane protein EccD [Rhodococcus sp. NPDC003318]|uniref:type VII secretion integral membrane protein EccD n=1 Tax=Rhodococcus sp. NPDC003318 TaxID=3364503 RepID=UPI00369A5F2F